MPRLDKKRYSAAYVKEIGSEDGFLADAIITSETVDREGDSINVDGLDFSNFVKNPVLLWAHMHSEMPIGRVTKIWKTADRMIHFSGQFDMEDPTAVKVFRKIKNKILNAFSIAFITKQQTDGRIDSAEVLEFSVVPIPANPEALAEVRAISGFAYKSFEDLMSSTEEVIMDATVKSEPQVEEVPTPKPEEPSAVVEEPKVEDQVSDPATPELPPVEQPKVETPEGSDSEAKNLKIRRLVKLAITSLDEANKELKKQK